MTKNLKLRQGNSMKKTIGKFETSLVAYTILSLRKKLIYKFKKPNNKVIDRTILKLDEKIV